MEPGVDVDDPRRTCAGRHTSGVGDEPQHIERIVEPTQHERLDVRPLQRRTAGQRQHGDGSRTGNESISWPDRSYDTTYDVRVQACSSERGCGPWSNWNSARTGSPPPPPQSVNLSRGGACSGASCPPPGSCSSTCYFYHIDATGFSANTSYNYTCYNNGAPFGVGGSRTTNGAGNFSGDLGCYNGFPGNKYVVFGGVQSDTENW